MQLGVERLQRPAARSRAVVDRVRRRPSAPRARRSGRFPLPGPARRSAQARARSPRRSTRSGGRRRSSRSRAISRTARRARGTPRTARAARRALRSPSRPVASASGFAPRSTLIPGITPSPASSAGNGVPSPADWRIVSSNRITPLMNSSAPGRREQEVAVGASRLLGRLDTDRVEALRDRARSSRRRRGSPCPRPRAPTPSREARPSCLLPYPSPPTAAPAAHRDHGRMDAGSGRVFQRRARALAPQRRAEDARRR